MAAQEGQNAREKMPLRCDIFFRSITSSSLRQLFLWQNWSPQQFSGQLRWNNHRKRPPNQNRGPERPIPWCRQPDKRTNWRSRKISAYGLRLVTPSSYGRGNAEPNIQTNPWQLCSGTCIQNIQQQVQSRNCQKIEWVRSKLPAYGGRDSWRNRAQILILRQMHCSHS